MSPLPSPVKMLQEYAFLNCRPGLTFCFSYWDTVHSFSMTSFLHWVQCPTTLPIHSFVLFCFLGGAGGGLVQKFFHIWFICRFHQACKQHTCCAVWVSFSDHRLLTKRGGKKDFYQTLFTGQWIFFTIWMYLWNAWVIHYSRFWSMTMGRRNDWWYLFPDFISLILFIPWPVYLD